MDNLLEKNPRAEPALPITPQAIIRQRSPFRHPFPHHATSPSTAPPPGAQPLPPAASLPRHGMAGTIRFGDRELTPPVPLQHLPSLLHRAAPLPRHAASSTTSRSRSLEGAPDPLSERKVLRPGRGKKETPTRILRF